MAAIWLTKYVEISYIIIFMLKCRNMCIAMVLKLKNQCEYVQIDNTTIIFPGKINFLKKRRFVPSKNR